MKMPLLKTPVISVMRHFSRRPSHGWNQVVSLAVTPSSSFPLHAPLFPREGPPHDPCPGEFTNPVGKGEQFFKITGQQEQCSFIPGLNDFSRMNQVALISPVLVG